jgi:CRP/FNR family transcriptional regulator, cyclic AMP receptor protein
MTITHEQLRELSFFAFLQPETINAISQRAFMRILSEGYTLLIEGMPAEFGYFIISGHVRSVRMNREGRVQVLARLTPGAPINLISLLTSEKVNRATIETLSPVNLLVLTATDFEKLLDSYPDFSKILLKIFAERIARMTDLASGLSLLTVKSRLAKFLIDLVDLPQSNSGWTQDEIAAHIGSVRDMVGRLLREFETQGLIRRDRQQILLLDKVGLQELAETPPD